MVSAITLLTQVSLHNATTVQLKHFQLIGLSEHTSLDDTAELADTPSPIGLPDTAKALTEAACRLDSRVLTWTAEMMV